MAFKEILRMALGALKTNRLRSALTMLGVTIGVFSVIGVMTAEAEVICFKVFDGGKPASYGRTKLQGLTLVGSNEWFLVANSHTLGYGRNLTEEDVDLGRAVAVV